MRSRSSKDENGEAENIELSVYDYFVNTQGRKLQYSADLPCINVGKPKRPTYFPIEVEFSFLLHFCKQISININLGSSLQFCSLVSLQRYTKALTVIQRSSLVEKSRQKPQEKINILTDVCKKNCLACCKSHLCSIMYVK